MFVTLPSGDRLPVPEDCLTVEQVKRFVERSTRFPRRCQRLILGRAVPADTDRLIDLDRASAQNFDLLLLIGDAYVFCSDALQTHPIAADREILQTVSGRHQDRTLSDLKQGKIRFHDMLDTRQLQRHQRDVSIARPYYLAHARTKASRSQALRDLCRKMDRRTFLVSAFNYGFRPMFENWAASCDKHGIDCRSYSILFPMDADADRLARDLGFETYFDDVSYGDQRRERSPAFGDETHVRSRFIKIAMVQDMIELGYDVLLQDIDLVWFKDPVPYLEAQALAKSCDFQFMYDGVNPLFQPLYYNSGFVFIRNNAFSRFAWNAIYESYDRVVYYQSDQVVVNIVVNCLRERGLRTRRLPEDAFANGHLIVEADRQGVSLPRPTYVVHASWTRDMETKIDKLKRHDMWFLPSA